MQELLLHVQNGFVAISVAGNRLSESTPPFLSLFLLSAVCPKRVYWHLFFLVYTVISRKAVGKNVHATVLEGNMGYDQYTVPDTVAVEPTFVSFSFSTRKHKSMVARAFFQIFLKNRELRISHNTFRECCEHFVRQPFSK